MWCHFVAQNCLAACLYLENMYCPPIPSTSSIVYLVNVRTSVLMLANTEGITKIHWIHRTPSCQTGSEGVLCQDPGSSETIKLADEICLKNHHRGMSIWFEDLHLFALNHVFGSLGEVAQACVAKIPVTWSTRIRVDQKTQSTSDRDGSHLINHTGGSGMKY